MFAEYCCEVPLNPFWRFCPNCGKATNTKREQDLSVADQTIKIMENRHALMRGDDPGEHDVD